MTAAVLATAVQAVGVSCEANALAGQNQGDKMDNGDEFNPIVNETDALTQPLCGLPGDGTRPYDRTPPLDNCCRIYELKNMYGTYFEICNWGEDEEERNEPMVAFLDSLDGSKNDAKNVWTWDNEVSSWKCGKRVDIKLCYDSDGGADGQDGSLTDCPGGMDRMEEGHATSGNGVMLMNDTVSKIIISVATDRDYATNGPGQVKATFFDDMNCTGTS